MGNHCYICGTYIKYSRPFDAHCWQGSRSTEALETYFLKNYKRPDKSSHLCPPRRRRKMSSDTEEAEFLLPLDDGDSYLEQQDDDFEDSDYDFEMEPSRSPQMRKHTSSSNSAHETTKDNSQVPTRSKTRVPHCQSASSTDTPSLIKHIYRRLYETKS